MMRIHAQANDLSVQHVTRALMPRMIGPLCGMVQRVSFMTRGNLDPRFMTAGAELTGVHILRGQPPPGINTYHIGGGGILLDEPLIRTLGESLERYSQLVAGVLKSKELVFASNAEMRARGEPVLAPAAMRFFTEQQYADPANPFEPFDAARPMSWIHTRSLLNQQDIWIPAQLLLVGYTPRRKEGEPWLLSAVTTGTAAHTSPARALRGSLLELIQIDAVMGHWYSSAQARKITTGQRTRALERLMDQHFPHTNRPAFYSLPSADLPGMVVACVIRDALGFPAVALGLGCDMRLGQAMYKALLEAIGVLQLAKITVLYQTPEQRQRQKSGEAEQFLDFDNNVAYYAAQREHAIIDEKFSSRTVAADDLPPDSTLDVQHENGLLIDAFRATGKELVMLDLTTPDLAALGFCSARVWSPDTTGLSLPAFPMAGHPRFAAYGGVCHSQPHPYP